MAQEAEPTKRPLNIEDNTNQLTITNEHRTIDAMSRLRRSAVGRELEPIISDLLYSIEYNTGFYLNNLRVRVGSDLRNLERRIDNASSVTNISVSLVVIPDAGQRVESLALVKSVESAVHVIREIGGLGETQIGIIDELIVPAIAELMEILNATASDVADLKSKRSRGMSLLGRVMSLGHAICSMVGLLDAIEKADAAEKALEVLNALRAITKLEAVWELFLDLLQWRP